MASAGALAAALLLLLCAVSASDVALAVGPAQALQHRLLENRGFGAATTTSATSPPHAARAPAAHRQHENPLEAVRFDLAAASLEAAVRRGAGRRPEEKGTVGSGSSGGPTAAASLRLAVNATAIHASPSTRAAQGLRVSWSGLPDPRPDDLVAVLLLQEERGPLSSAAPAKFSLLGGGDSGGETEAPRPASSNGSLELRLANYLSPYVAVALFRGGTQSPRLAEGESVVMLRNAAHPRAPLHRRLSLAAAAGGQQAGNGTTVALAVRWTTRLAGGSPGVWWTDEPPQKEGGGSGNTRLRSSFRRFAPAAAPPLTIARDEMCGGDARGLGYAPPGYFHTAVMTGLVPGRRYWYVVGDGGGEEPRGINSNTPPPPPPEEEVRSPEASFVAPPSSSSSSSSDERVRVLVTADMGQAEPDGWSQTPDYTRAASVRTARALAREVGATSAAGAAAKSGGAPPVLPSLVIHAGDISYARGYAALWAAFHDLVEPVASRVPYMVAAGNHEVDWPSSLGSGGDRFAAETGEAGARARPPRPEGGTDAARWRDARGQKPARDVFDSGGECGVAYARRFAMPTNGAVLSSASSSSSAAAAPPTDERRPWYAFDHGPSARFVVFSTEHDFMPGSEQHAFLERAFAGARGSGGDGKDAKQRPWLILIGHRPMHVCSSWDSFADSDGAVSRALRAALDPLLSRYGVDLTISGHHHSYGRTCAVVPSSSSGGSGGAGDEGLGPTCAPGGGGGGSEGEEEEAGGKGRGTVHLVAGNGGAPISLNPSFPPSPVWRRLRYDWGYLRLDVSRERLAVELVSPRENGGAGEVVDRFELRR